MRIKLFFLAGALFAIVGRISAGSLELPPKETAPPTITQSEPWQFTIAAPGWLASMNGTIGVRGVNADIDVPVDEVLQHLDMIFAMRAEARSGIFEWIECWYNRRRRHSSLGYVSPEAFEAQIN